MRMRGLNLIFCLLFTLGSAAVEAGFEQATAAFESGDYPAARELRSDRFHSAEKGR